MDITAKDIHDKALELGYAACGIIKAVDMSGYEDMINKRVERFPATEQYHAYFKRYAKPEEWVKSIIVCAGRYGKYKIPEELQGRIAKYYLTDYRVNPESKEKKSEILFEQYLTENDVQFKKGNSAGKYAAVKAGIGVVRKNNLLYTRYGSWIWLETWLIDRDIEYICENDLPPCPDDCTKCVEACATGALAEPYQVNAFACTSTMTYGGLPLPPEDLRMKMKSYLYGCDDCQDCCPVNNSCWIDSEQLSELENLREYLTLEQLCTLSNETIKNKIMPKFFYINNDKIWKWKTNALRVMLYEYKPEYLPYMKQATEDKNEFVREMAEWVLGNVK